MTHSSNIRRNIAIFLIVLSLSAVTMVWLFWHHPVQTAIGTIAVLAVLGLSARLARSIEDSASASADLDQPSI